MKIAYVHDVIYPHVKGGAEKRVWEISRRLADRGHEVHIFGMKYWEGRTSSKERAFTSTAHARPRTSTSTEKGRLRRRSIFLGGFSGR